MPYFARKVKRICDVRGCRNTDCYAISKSREAGKSIIICKECFKGGLAAVEELEKNTPVVKTTGPSAPPPLFFHPEVKTEPEQKGAVPPEDKPPEVKAPANGKKKSK